MDVNYADTLIAVPTAAGHARLRDEFLARPQACLRASPLPKRHGFGPRCDGAGRVALCPMESDEVAAGLSSGGGPVRSRAMDDDYDDDADDGQEMPKNGWSWVCQSCGGDGVEIRQRAAIFREGTGTANTPENCRACDGTGRIPAHS